MATGSHSEAGTFDPRDRAPGEPFDSAAGLNGAAAQVDPSAYREPGPGPDAPPGDAGGEAAKPIPHGVIAALLARLGSAGIADPARVQEFERAYRGELEELFGWLDLSDALAEYGITLGDGAPMPAWMRIFGAAGGAGVLLLMRRPELVGRMSAAMRGASRREAAEDGDNDEGATAGGRPGPAAAGPEGVGYE